MKSMLQKFYPYEYAESVFVIDYEKLYQAGYRGLAFDIDNTLVHHGDDAAPEVEALFRALHQIGFKTLLLTNNDEERVQRFLKNIDSLYICDAEKPNPDCYYQAVDRMALSPKEVLFIGDQIFTDILGANQSGMASILVHFIRLKNEKRIGKKRYLEKAILAFYKRNRKYRHRLGDILLSPPND